MKITIQGERELYANIARLANVGNTKTDGAMKDALEPMLQDTIQNAKVHRQSHTPKGGHLDEGVVSRKVKEKSRTRNTWWVSFTKRARRIAHLVEFGTRPHAQPRRRIIHPGARPSPFFRPAFEAHKQDTLSRLGNSLWQIFRNNLQK